MAGGVLADFVIMVTANVDQAVGALAALDGSLAGLAGLGAAMSAIGEAMTIGITAPIMAVGAGAVLSAMNIQKFYETLQAGAVGGKLSLGQLEDSWNQLYAKFPQGGDEIANTLLNVSNVMGKTFGENQQQITDFASKFLELSGMTGEDADKMSQAVTQAFNQWHVPAQDATQDLTYLWQAAEQARVPITTLGDQLGQYSQIMVGAGFNIQDTTAALAQMDQQGMDVSKTVTGMAYGMATLAAGGKTVQPILNDISKEEGGMSTATMSTHDMWDGLVKGIQDGSITMGDATAIFGKRYAENIYNAIKGGHLSFEQFEQDAGQFGTSIDKAWQNVETFGQKLEVLKHDLEEALAPLGNTIIDSLESFMPVIQTILGGVAALFTAFNSLPAPITDFVLLLAAAAAAAGPLLWIGGSLIAAFVSVAGAVGTVVGIFTAFWYILIPIGAAIAVVVGFLATLAAGLYLAYTYSATFRSLLGTLSDAFNTFGQSVSKALGQLMSGDWNGAFQTLSQGLQQLETTLESIDWTSVGQWIVQEVQTGLNNNMPGIIHTFDTLKDDLATWINQQNWTQIGQDLGQALGTIIGVGINSALAGLNSLSTSSIGTGSKQDPLQHGQLGTGPSVTGPSDTSLTQAGTTAGENFMTGFSTGLQEGMGSINWGGIASALVSGLLKALEGSAGAGAQVIADIFGFGGPNGGPSDTGLGSILDNAFGNGPLTSGWWLDKFSHLPSWSDLTKGGILDPSFWSGIKLPDVGGALSSWWNGIKWPSFSLPSLPGGTIILSSLFAGFDPQSILGPLESLGGQIMGIFSGIHITLPAVPMPSLAEIESIPGKIMGWFSGIHLSLPGIDVSAVTGPLNTVLTLINEILSALPGVAVAKKTVSDTLAWVGQEAASIEKTAGDIWNTAMSLGGQVATKLSQIGSDISTAAGNFWSTLQNIGGRVVSTLEGIGSQIATGAQGFWANLQGIGSQVMQGLSNIGNSISQGAQNAYNSLNSLASGVYNYISGIWGNVENAASAVWNYAETSVSNASGWMYAQMAGWAGAAG